MSKIGVNEDLLGPKSTFLNFVKRCSMDVFEIRSDGRH